MSTGGLGFKRHTSFSQDMVDPVTAAIGANPPEKPLFEPLKEGKTGLVGRQGPSFSSDEPVSPTSLGPAAGGGAAGRAVSPQNAAGSIVTRAVSPPGTNKLPPLSPQRIGTTSSTGGMMLNPSSPVFSQTFVPPVVPSMEPVVPNAHFTNPEPQPPLPWEMNYADRRAVSSDPRIVKQVKDEKQWELTCVRGVWGRIRRFCFPHLDWMMTPESALPLWQDCGIVSPTLIEKLLKLFDLKKEEKKEGHFNGLVMCKLIEIGLTQAEFSEGFVKHCFDRFDRSPASGGRISKAQFRQVKLLDPLSLNSKKKGKGGGGGGGGSARGGKGKKNALPLTTLSGATFAMVQGFLQIFDQSTAGNMAVKTEDDKFVTYQEFAKEFLDPRRAEWVGTFLGPLLEACAQYFAPPLGKLPYLSVRWLKTTTPVQTATDELGDADALLLQELERTGGVDELAEKNKKKKKKPTESKK